MMALSVLLRIVAGLGLPCLLFAGMACATRTPLRTGFQVLAAESFAGLHGRRVGVVVNPTSVDGELRSLVEVLAAEPDVELAAIFSPEHGAWGAVAAGIRVADQVDPQTGVPVYSLYGKVRRPTAHMLEGLDVVLFDIQDIGVRTYTYLATLKEVLIACSGAAVEVWVLDRPLPAGGDRVGGPVLERGHESFVGPHPVALLHGLTAGEFALLVREEAELETRLRVVAMEGYRRASDYEDHGSIWVAPSPNIPTVDSARVYGGMVLVEGTNLSEGRGTTRPFFLVGAPWVDGTTLARELNALALPGCRFRAATFTPTASKYQGEVCFGVELHLTERRLFRPVVTGVALLTAVRRLFPDEFRFRPEAFDRLAGTSKVRREILAGTPYDAITASWDEELEAYQARRRRVLLYR